MMSINLVYYVYMVCPCVCVCACVRACVHAGLMVCF